MRRMLRLTLVALLALSLCVGAEPASAAPQVVSSTDLIEHATKYDTQEITYAGEAIGDLMVRGDHAWVNVSDGTNAVGLWLTADQARQIKALGSYRGNGDRIIVTGVFHRACAEHGGDLDVHVSELAVAATGAPTPHPVLSQRIVLAVLLTSLAAALYAADRQRARSQGRRTRNPE